MLDYTSMTQSCRNFRYPKAINDRLRVDSGAVRSHVEKMLYAGTDPESYITEYTLVYED